MTGEAPGANEADDVNAERAPELVRIEQIYPVDHPSAGSVARRVSGPNGRMELALFAPDGREVVDLEVVKRAFIEVSERAVVPVFREEVWVVERHGMRCRVVRDIEPDGRREIVAINALNGDQLGPSLPPDPPTRAIWGRLIELSTPATQRPTR